ncbi:hypothetical protein FQR65_LT12322 [Abscondita terminalis]|nr:hypothetical protein FQR65_LT12322 [Abscondita terminalis]
MSQKNESSGSNTGMYLLAGVVGAVAAGVGYFMGRESERSHVAARPPVVEQVPNYTDNDTDCAVCLQKFSPIKTLPCKHQFHASCINKWLEIQKTCPKCNRQVE